MKLTTASGMTFDVPAEVGAELLRGIKVTFLEPPMPDKRKAIAVLKDAGFTWHEITLLLWGRDNGNGRRAYETFYPKKKTRALSGDDLDKQALKLRMQDPRVWGFRDIEDELEMGPSRDSGVSHGTLAVEACKRAAKKMGADWDMLVAQWNSLIYGQ